MSPRSTTSSPAPRPAGWSLVALTLAVLGLNACTGEQPSASAAPDTSAAASAAPRPAAAEPAAVAAPAEAPKPEPLTAAALDPVLREVGPAGAAPERVVIELARPIRDDQSNLTALLAMTSLKFEPEVKGSLSFTSPTTLEFVPKAPFAPDTRYKMTLERVETMTGPVMAPPGGWTREFTTPKFGLLRAALGEVNAARRQATVNLVFSGPVDDDEVSSRVSFSTPQGRVTSYLVTATSDSSVVRAQLNSVPMDLSRRGELRVSLRAGLPLRGRAEKAPSAEAKVELWGEQAMTIHKVFRAEAATGHYLDVICDDGAVPQKHYYWDNVNYDSYEISRRCMLEDADAQEGIRFEPPVKVSVTPSAGGFRIFGDFKRGTYQLRIREGLRTVDGGVLQGAFEGTFTFPARSPRVEFVSQGRYLPRKALKGLPVKHVNAENAELLVRQVPPANLVFWMSNDYSESANETTSDLVARQKIALKAAPDAQGTSWVDLATLLPRNPKGLYELTLQAPGSSASSRLLLTDIQLVAKRTGAGPERPWGEELAVWALHSETLEPLPSVEVKLVKKSGLPVGACTTSGDGACRIKIPQPDVDPAPPFAVVAQQGDDLTYLKFGELEVQVADAKVQGEPFRAVRPYRATLYSDRGVYRPGETAHLVAILRDRDDRAPKAGLPVELRVVDPRERELKRTTVQANEAGQVLLDLPFASFAPTGSYRVFVNVGGNQAGEYGFKVEEFVPERMKVEAKALADGYLAGDAADVAVDARYLFGGIPANSQVELTCELQAAEFAPKENAQLRYGVHRPEGKPFKPIALGATSGSLDEKGAGIFKCPSPEQAISLPGPARLVARAAVFEAGSGRTTVGEATAPVHPERFYLGLSVGAQKAVPGKPIAVSGTVVDWKGALTASAVDEVEVQLVRLDDEWGWWYDEAEGEGSYRRHQRPVVESKQKVPASGGRFTATLTPAENASVFLIRAKAGRAQTDFSLEGQGSYYWEPSESRADLTPRPFKPTWVDLELPGKVRVGEPAKVSFKAPYRGKVLLTAETDRVLRAEWKKVEAGPNEWTFSLDGFAPNVYVSAFLVKDPHLDSAESFTPDRAFGVRSVAVEPVEFTSEIRLTVPKEVRSNEKLTVDLEVAHAEGATFATVAAVDEGILSLTRFQTPDPMAELFAQRALGVQTFETVGWTLLLPAGGPSSSTGGDGAGGGGRVQPVKPVALWSGLVPVKDGKARVTFEVPTYRGSLRVMAVAAGPRRIGRASANVVVRDPLTLQATLPRFLSAGDEIQIPVFVTNLSGSGQQVTVSLSVQDLPYPGLDSAADEAAPVEIVGKAERQLSLKDGDAQVAVFLARALKSVGAARFEVTARAGALVSRETSDVPLLPAAPRSRELRRIALTEGTLDLKPHLAGWVPTTEQSTFWVTANPYGEAFDHLSYLLHYPHGCIEQTTSGTRPLLVAGNLVGNVDPQLVASGKLEDMAMSGINRVLSMQTATGGFAYWPGGTEPNDWGTAYATHMLLDAQKLGFNVPKSRLDDALRFLEDRVANHYENQNSGDRAWDWHGDSEPYMQYVLAVAGKGRKARIQRLIDRAPGKAGGERLEQEYLLKAALYLSGDHRYEKDLKSPDLSRVTDERSWHYTYYSDRRRRGVVLSTFQDLFGNAPEGEPLANLVAESLRGHSSGWYTTQEIVWAVTGLGKRVAGSAKDLGAVTMSLNGKPLAPKTQTKAGRPQDLTFAVRRASEARSISLTVAKKAPGDAWLFLTSEGIREKAEYKAGGEGLALSRRYLDQSGSPINLKDGSHALGDMVFVELMLTNNTSERLTNIALVDRFPAGWEVENPRLGRGQAVEWVKEEELWQPDYMNVRDDRLEVFGALNRGEYKKVVYAVRAVTAGNFQAPPAEAEAMYDPRVWARQLGERIEIAGPWADEIN